MKLMDYGLVLFHCVLSSNPLNVAEPKAQSSGTNSCNCSPTRAARQAEQDEKNKVQLTWITTVFGKFNGCLLDHRALREAARSSHQHQQSCSAQEQQRGNKKSRKTQS